MTVKPQIPDRLEAQVIATALEMACENDLIRRSFPMANRALLFDLRDRWKFKAEGPVTYEGSE